MEEDDVYEQIKDVPDILSKRVKDRETLYAQQVCPQCLGNSFKKKTDATKLFTPNDPLPRYQLECNNCSCLMDPFSGLILKIGNVGKAYQPGIPILKTED
jgi:hypothetical protein